MTIATGDTTTLTNRVDGLDWAGLRDQLDDRGFAVTAPLLGGAECAELSDLFDGGRFRSTIDMARHRFGDGRYRYFEHPLPAAIQALRTSFYGRLAPIANDWSERLRGDHPSSRSTTTSCSGSAATRARSARPR